MNPEGVYGSHYPNRDSCSLGYMTPNSGFISPKGLQDASETRMVVVGVASSLCQSRHESSSRSDLCGVLRRREPRRLVGGGAFRAWEIGAAFTVTDLLQQRATTHLKSYAGSLHNVRVFSSFWGTKGSLS